MSIDRLGSDSVSSRTLERSVDAGNVTVESCVSACQAQSFTTAGLEYAQECCESTNLLCDGTLVLTDDSCGSGCGNGVNSPGASISQSACYQPCVGNSAEICGGPNALQLYY